MGVPMKMLTMQLLHFDVRAGDVLFWPRHGMDCRGWCGICLKFIADYGVATRWRIFRLVTDVQIIERHRVTHFACGPTMIRGFAATKRRHWQANVVDPGADNGGETH